jgi:YesN/AraC family two-component response regulator
LHGGSITATSTPRQGSNFTFWLPAAPENYQAADFVPDKHLEQLGPELSSLAMGEMLPSSSPADQKDKASVPLILLIEDNAEVRAYLLSCLQDSYQILEAENGARGIDLAIEQIPDLIITDVMMPEKDGFTVTQELKQDPLTNHIPIIILTGKSSQESKLEGLETEAEAFLTKPFDAEELRLRIQGLLNNRNRLQEKFSRRLLLESGLVEVTSSDEAFLNEAAAIVEANLGDENFSIEKLAEALNISRSQAFRKIKALTNQSPSRFTRSIRLKRAKQLIEGRAGTIAEIAYSVGFSSPTYFSKCFKEQYGQLPGEL